MAARVYYVCSFCEHKESLRCGALPTDPCPDCGNVFWTVHNGNDETVQVGEDET